MSIELDKEVILPHIPMTSSKIFKMEDYRGSYVVLYFYPKDATPGCTAESTEFSDNYHNFLKINTKVFGISKDTLASHEAFKNKYNIYPELIADTDKTLCNAFQVIKEKSMFGKRYMGIERSTFIINPEGRLIKEWRKVKVTGHVNKVLSFIRSLNF